MRLRPGSTLGYFTDLSPLGAGGMGEVFRATDVRLGRPVALKLLPQKLSRSNETLQRFRIEAKTLARLNHPNIATIRGLEELDGNFW